MKTLITEPGTAPVLHLEKGENVCAICKKQFKKWDQVYYCNIQKKIFCLSCGKTTGVITKQNPDIAFKCLNLTFEESSGIVVDFQGRQHTHPRTTIMELEE